MKKLLKSKLMFLLVMGVIGVFAAGCGQQAADNGSAGGQDAAAKSNYPERNIETVVGWGAGGGTDVFTRAITAPMGKILDTNFVVVNKPGAAGSLAGDYLTRQPADGYTIWAISSNYPVNVASGKTPHLLDEYIPVARIQHDTATIQVNADSKYKDIQSLIDAAKANPGKVTIGGTGAMGFDQIVVSRWEKAAGVKFNYVPYEKAGEMHAALMGGHIDSMIEEFGPTIDMIKDGKIKVVLAFTESKLSDFPDVPVAPDLGWDVTDGQSRGIMVKKGTPDEVVKALENALKEAKASESYQKYEKDKYLNLREGWLGADDFKASLEQDINNYKTVLAELQ